jgi:hypothetical protein
VNASNGVATFSNLSIDKVGTGYTLKATSNSLTQANSSAFNITVGAAAKLAITSVNGGSNPTAGTAFSVVVQSQDASGNPANVTASTGVSLSLNTGTGMLGGTLTGNINNNSNSVTINGVTYSKAESGVILTATQTSGNTLTAGNSAPFTVNAGTASRLVITGSPTQTAGTSQNLTITAKDASGNTVTSYTGDKSLTFSGANPSTNPATNPVVTDKSGAAKNFGTATTITFSNGVATVSGLSNGLMTLYKAEAATIAASDGAGASSTGADRLTVTVSAGNLAQFALSLTSPQANAAVFTGTNTLTAQDAWGNTVTGFNAATDNVTIVANAPLVGTVSGLGSGANNVLNQATNFVSGVANLTTLKYTGNATTGTFTATSASGKTGISGNVTINGGALDHFKVEAAGGGPIGTQTAGTAFNIMVTAQDASNNTVTSFDNNGNKVMLTSTGALTGSPITTAAFTNGVLSSQSVTITNTGNFTITATGIGGNSGKTGTSNLFTVNPGAPTHLVFLQQPTNAQAGASIAPAVTVQVEDANNNVVTTGTGSTASVGIAILANPGGGTLSGTTPVNAVAGVGTFSDLSINKTGTGYTLQATSTGLTSVTSTAFNITPAAASKLAFAVQPSDASAGQAISPAVTVQVQDRFGNLTSSTASVGVAILNNPGPAGTVLSGTTPVNAVSGTATFSDLSINKGGTGYTLQATSSGLTSATSAAFTINNPASTLTSIAPTSGNLSQTLDVVFAGTNFIAGASTVNFGPNITVNTATVNSSTQITANITIGAGATVGPRDVSVTNSAPGGGTATLMNGFTVNNPATNTTVTSSSPTSTYGDPVTFTATVTSGGGTPAGSITFYDSASCSGTVLASLVPLDGSGKASFPTSSLSAGPHTITACYTPTGIFQPSNGSVAQDVNKATLTITAKDESKAYGTTFTPDGTTQFTTSGLLFSDSVTSVTLSSSGYVNTAAVSGSPYDITPSAAVGTGLGNYDISFVSGSLTINKKAISYTIGNASHNYGSTVNLATALGTTFLTGVNGENLSIAYSSTGNTVTAVPGMYAITGVVSDGTGLASNYTVTLTPGTLTVNKAPLTITADNKTKQYSDPITFTVTYVGFVNGEGPSVLGGTLVFNPTAADAQFLSPVTPTNTTPATYTITPSGLNSSNYAITFKTGTLTETQEDARATYAGTLFASTSSSTSSTATVTLSATIQDITAVTADPAYDPYPGDIRNAKVTFVNRDVPDNTNPYGFQIIATNLVPGLVNASDMKTGTVTCNWSVNIGSNDSQQYTIGIIVTNYYTRNNSTDDTVITVSKAVPGSITGGGYLVMQSSAGLYPGGVGTKNNFGFNVKNASNSPKGNINTIIRNSGRTYQIKGNAMTSLSINTVITGTHPYPTATFNGKANIQDITNPLAPISIDGNATLQVTMTDKGEPGSSDTIAITVWNKSGGLWFSSNWTGTQTIEQILGGGNLQVH